jgi:hypothetical protein
MKITKEQLDRWMRGIGAVQVEEEDVSVEQDGSRFNFEVLEGDAAVHVGRAEAEVCDEPIP